MTLVSSVYCSMYDCCQIMVCIPCNTMLWLCHDWRGKLHSLAQAFQSTFEPPPHHLTNRQQQSKLVLQARVTKKGMIALTVKVFYWCTVLQQARQIIGRQAGGNSVALCCLRLFYIGNIPSLFSLHPSHTLWCDFTVVTLIQAHFDLALSCCSFLAPSRYHPPLPGVHTLQLLTPTTPRLIL